MSQRIVRYERDGKTSYGLLDGDDRIAPLPGDPYGSLSPAVMLLRLPRSRCSVRSQRRAFSVSA